MEESTTVDYQAITEDCSRVIDDAATASISSRDLFVGLASAMDYAIDTGHVDRNYASAAFDMRPITMSELTERERRIAAAALLEGYGIDDDASVIVNTRHGRVLYRKDANGDIIELHDALEGYTPRVTGVPHSELLEELTNYSHIEAPTNGLNISNYMNENSSGSVTGTTGRTWIGDLNTRIGGWPLGVQNGSRTEAEVSSDFDAVFDEEERKS